MGTEKELEKLETVKYVDLERFMGDWYVIANIPTFIEKGAVNAIESLISWILGVELKQLSHLKRIVLMVRKKPTIQQGSFMIRKQMLNGECNSFGHLNLLF